jgi:hypothetical protein
MFVRAFACVLSFLMLSGCGSAPGGFADKALDDTLYRADTKAERLLRYFEIQTLLVQYAASSAGSISERNAIALANLAATDQLNTLVGCLQVGSVNYVPPKGGPDTAPFSGASPSAAVRTDGTYCSFFESRLINYEAALLSMLRQATRADPNSKVIENLITGGSVLDFTTIVTDFVQLATGAIRDAILLRAFTEDALELENLVWLPYTSPSQVHPCNGQAPFPCNDPHLSPTDSQSIDALRAELAAKNGVSADGLRPTILVWHFQEVQAYMMSACISLNNDAEAVNGGNNTNCSAILPFSVPPVRQKAR